jgi:hypothetical protein
MNIFYKKLNFFVFCLFASLFSFSLSEPIIGKEKNEPVPELANWYMDGLKAFHQEAAKMDQLAKKQINWSEARIQFTKMRLAYKRISFLTDHFNAYETLQLNSAALPRAEEDNPDQIILPQGMQRIEELLWQEEDTAELQRQTATFG